MCLFRDSLSHRHDGVHVTQAIGQRFHHMRRKVRMSAEPESETDGGRFAPGATGSLPQRWRCVDCRQSTPSHQEASPGPQSRTQNRRGKCRLPLLIRRTSLSPCSPSRNRKSPGASCSVSVSLRNSSAGFICQVQLLAAIERRATTAKLQLCDRQVGRSFKEILRVLRALRG